MKKWMKRIISIALISVMTLGLATAAMADNAHFIFTDIDEPQPDLYVAKTVSSAVEGYTAPDSTFTFVLQWDQDGDGYLEPAENEIYYVYNQDGTQVYNEAAGSYIFRTGSAGQFTLKDGQYARFEWVGQVAYEITELVEDPYINMSGDKSGTVDASGTYVTFENLYVPEDTPGGDTPGATTQLIIRKDIAWVDGYEMPDLSDLEFGFTVKVDGALYANEAYDIYDVGMTTKIDSGRTESDGTFSMTGDTTVVFHDVEVGVDYEVSETGNVDGWRATGQTSYAGATTSPMVYCYFNNEGADFIVTKDRADGATGQAFSFILSDDADNPMADVPYYTYDAKGNLTGSGMTDADGGFLLCAGEQILFTGIPDGAEYKITENVGDQYIVTSDDADDDSITDTEDYDRIDKHTFVNEELTDITITKYGSRLNSDRNLLGGAAFTIYQLKDGGDPDDDAAWEPYPDADKATKTTDSTEGSETYGMLTFESLPAGTYRIVETEVPEGYVKLGDPIEVTLPFTSENEVDGAVYSERDGVYYIYDLEYAVDNMAQLITMPNTGSKAWIIFLIAVGGGVAALGSVYVYRRRHSGKEKGRV